MGPAQRTRGGALLSVCLALLTLQAAGQSLKRSVYLSEHTHYRDFVPLTAENLTSTALQDESAWVIHLHDGFLEPEIKRLAGEVRGLVRFGLVSREDAEAVDLLKLDTSNHFFRSLPFGWESRKQSKFLDTDSFLDALAHASASVPADFVTVLRSEKATKALLSEAVVSKPSRFTVIFASEDDQPSLLQRVLSRKLIRNFNFGLVPNANKEEALKSVGLTGLTIPVPGMAVLMVTKSGAVRSTRMTDESAGREFAETLRFLVEFNRQFRAELPGDARAKDRTVLYMSDILDAERLIFQIDDAADSASEASKAPEDGKSAPKTDSAGEDLKDEL